MRYEIIGSPPEKNSTSAVREDFDRFLTGLEHSDIRSVSVVFGFAWGMEIYDGDWTKLNLSINELRKRVETAESQNLGRIGCDDLHVTVPELNIEQTYCHETDVHIVADSEANLHLESQRKFWLEHGWDVSARHVA
jgi:hypothetical protein